MKLHQLLLYIFSIIWRADKKYLLIKSFNSIVMGFYPMINVLFSKYIVYLIESNKSPKELIIFLFYFLSLQFIFLIWQTILNYYDSFYSIVLSFTIRKNILLHVSTLDISFFEDPELFDTLQKAQGESGGRIKSTFDLLLSLISLIITLISVSYVLISLGNFTTFLLILLSLLAFTLISKSKKQHFEFINHTILKSRENGYLGRLLSSPLYCKEVRIFNLKNWLIEKIKLTEEWIIRENKAFLKKNLLLTKSAELINTLQYIGIYGALAIQTLAAQMPISDFTMAMSAAQTMTSSFSSILSSITIVYENCLFTKNLKTFLELTPEIENGNIIPDQTTDKNLVIENISFQYPNGYQVFEDFSLTIKHGEKLLIVGENGSGKSTLIQLILRLYDPTSGTIQYDNMNIKSYDIIKYRELFSVVFQDYNKYALSIKENVVFDKKVSDQDIEKALQYSGLSQKLESMPRGIYTPITREFSSDGIDFSVGEMQKIALARAYIKQSPYIILDEPTSALDPLSEYQMYQSFLNICENKTAIFISHRLSCAQYMDRIIVMNQGKIIESGTHKELIELGGEYFSMYQKQSAGYQYINEK